jgi:hypothetical protein
MSQVVLKTGSFDDEGHEETLTEYLCDWPDCPNVAVHALGCARELRMATAVCEEHLAMIKAQAA